jgi:hypothetical protein
MRRKIGSLAVSLALPLLGLVSCGAVEEVDLPATECLTDSTIGVGETLFIGFVNSGDPGDLYEWAGSYDGAYSVSVEGDYDASCFSFGTDTIDGFLVTCETAFEGTARFVSATVSFGQRAAKFGTDVRLRSDGSYRDRPSFVRGYETKDDCSYSKDYEGKGFWGLEASNRVFDFNPWFCSCIAPHRPRVDRSPR